MKKKIIFLILIVFCFLISAQNIKLIFRYDDFKLKSNSLDEKLVSIFNKQKVPLVLGVIPCDENEKLILEKNYPFLPVLKKDIQNGLIEIALHGLTHQKITRFGEFKGLSLKEQSRKIHKGKSLLESALNCRIVTFIPPWNSHDFNTVQALKLNGINIISSSVYDVWTEACFYPFSADKFEQVENIVNNNLESGGLIVVMLHSYNFGEKNSLHDLEKELIELNRNPQIAFYTFKSINEEGTHISDYQNDQIKRQNLLSKVLKLEGNFQSDTMFLIVNIVNSLLYLLFASLIFIFWQRIILKNFNYKLRHYLLFIIIGIIICFSTFNFLWGPLKILAVTLNIAILLPLMLLIQKKRKGYPIHISFRNRPKKFKVNETLNNHHKLQ